MSLFNIIKYFFLQPKKPQSNSEYQAITSFQDRMSDSTNIRSMAKHKIPIIIEKEHNVTLPSLRYNKIVIPKEITVEQLLTKLRTEMLNIESTTKLFLYFGTDKKLPELNETMDDLYQKYKNEDGFLYCKYSK